MLQYNFKQGKDSSHRVIDIFNTICSLYEERINFNLKSLNKIPIEISILVITILILSSCTKEPTAFFTYAPDYNLEVGESIHFYNKSTEATDYQWDFGNGKTSTEESPYFVYSDVGDYLVSLVAENSSGAAVDSQIITIHEATTLMLLILKPDGETPLANCKTKVYDTEDNLINDVNPLYWDNTDDYGMAVQ